MFASAFLVSEQYFVDTPLMPQIALDNIQVRDETLSDAYYEVVRRDCVFLVESVICKALLQLAFTSKSSVLLI